MARRIHVGLPHHDQYPAAWIADARCPPLPAVYDVMIAISANLCLDVGGVGGRDGRFRHQIRRASLAREQRFQPFLFLLASAIALEQLHVAGVRCAAVKHLRGKFYPPHDLAQRRVFEILQARSARALGQKQVPQALAPCPQLEVLHYGWNAPALGARAVQLLLVSLLGRVHVRIHEFLESRYEFLRARVVFKVHDAILLTLPYTILGTPGDQAPEHAWSRST